MTLGASLGVNVLGGIFNTLYGGSFYPDASLLGVSLNLSCNLTDILANKLGASVAAHLGRANTTSLGRYFMNRDIASIINSALHISNIPLGILPVRDTIIAHSLPDIGVTFSIELVTTATDLKQAMFMSIAFSSNLALGSAVLSTLATSISGTIYAGAVWNLSTIDGYRGSFVSLGGQVSNGTISGGVNMFIDTSDREKGDGLVTYGITTSVSIGTASFSGYGFGGSVGGTLLHVQTPNEGYDQIAPYLLSGLWYGPALRQKAWVNSRKQ
jgi:hypothetical protein